VASEKREPDPSLKDRLFKEFYRFSFFKAVHLLELLFPEKKQLGQTLTPGEETVRFSVKPGLSFPPSDISNLTQEEEKRPANMEVAFMGLIGPSGVLPYWYNELAVERLRQKDFGFTAFLDIFHHRLISLFYLAWAKYRFPENFLPGAGDRLSRHLLSLIGLGTPGLAGKIGLPQESLIYNSGLLSRLVPSAAAIEGTVEYFSGTRAEVEQFIDRTLSISPEDQTQLGVANGQLGVDAICGNSAWENQTKFRIHLGPMSYGYFLRLLPAGDLLRPIFSLVGYMVGVEYEFEIRLILTREEVPPCVLGLKSPASPRLGWSTWLKTPGVHHRENPYVTFEDPESPL
jgi:type VI secretion system protein ImpH